MFVDRLAAFIAQNELFNTDDRIGAALSGGADSVALVCALKELGYNITALHVEHGIRGEESVSDMRFVMELCGRLSVPLEIKRVSVPSEKQGGESVEEAARRLRYAFFNEKSEELGLKYIAVAHHIEDACETVVHNLLRGSGIKGLCSMRAKREPNIVRPLLFATRADIEEYLKQAGVGFVTDSTNADNDYTRNYIRSELMPRLERVNPRYRQAIMRTSCLAAEDDDALDMMARQSFNEAASIAKGEVLLDIKKMRAYHPAIAKRVIRLAFSKVYSLKDVSYLHIQTVYELIKNGGTGKKFALDGKIYVKTVYDHLKIYVKEDIINSCAPVALNLNGQTVIEGRGVITVGGECEIAKDAAALTQLVNADALIGAVVRTRQAGDRFTPLGSGGKKLKDWFIDKKIPADKRDMPLIAKGSEVLWVTGGAISEKLRVDKGTKNAVAISYNEISEESNYEGT